MVILKAKFSSYLFTLSDIGFYLNMHKGCDFPSKYLISVLRAERLKC